MEERERRYYSGGSCRRVTNEGGEMLRCSRGKVGLFHQSMCEPLMEDDVDKIKSWEHSVEEPNLKSMLSDLKTGHVAPSTAP
ncbi:hypothetical protein QQP08_025887 [Theobroma cacao]|nr:hypothetical protein QQP08_025887 [Theobroma cacao]